MSKTNTIQIVRDAKGAPIAAVVPWATYQRLRKETSEDAQLIALAKPHRGEEVFPAEIANRLIDGEVPLKVLREWRDFTQAGLAKRAGVALQYISQIERGERKLGRRAAARLARVLKASLEVLMDL